MSAKVSHRPQESVEAWKQSLRSFEAWLSQARKPKDWEEADRLLAEFIAFARTNGPVLNVGCGPGTFGKAIAFEDYVGIDPLGRPTQYFRFVQGVAESLPFKASTFPNIVTLCAMDHFASTETAVREFHRVFRPRGRLFVWQHVIRTDPWFKVSRVIDYLRDGDIRGLTHSVLSNLKPLLRIPNHQDEYGHTIDFTDRQLVGFLNSHFAVARVRYDRQQMFIEAERL